jgi:hypothetical protein
MVAKRLKRPVSVTYGLPQLGVSNGVAERSYNLPLSPKRQLLRMLPWLKSVFGDLLDKKITFQSSNRPGLGTDCGSGTINEQESIDLDDLAYSDISKIFDPRVIEFTAPVPEEFEDMMTERMYGVLQFTATGSSGREWPLEGFILEAGITPGNNAAFDFKVLLSPDFTLPDDL